MPPSDRARAAEGAGPAPTGRRTGFVLLCLAHLINDSYLNFIPLVLPALLASGRAGLVEGGLLASAFFFTATVLQPLLSRLGGGDRGRWPSILGTAWAAVLLALLAVPLPFPALLAMAGLAGLGVAAFHPFASALVFRLGPEGRGRRMSVFLAAGNLGWVITPLYLPRLLSAEGLQGVYAAAVPGVLASLVMLAAFRRPAVGDGPARAGLAWPAADAGLPAAVGLIVLIVALRSWANFGLLTLLPVYFAQDGLDGEAAGSLVAVFTAAGVAGGLAGGYLSDRWGRRCVTAASLVLSAVFLAIFLLHPGALAPVFLALGGAALLASFPVTLVAAQEVLAHDPALAAGLLLGLAVGLGGLGVAAAGRLAEAWGVGSALGALAAAPLGAALLSARMPEGRLAAAISGTRP